MTHDELIARLAADATAQRRVPVRVQMARAAGLAAAGILAIVLLWGVRSDLDRAWLTTMFWVKLAYGGVIAVVAIAAGTVLMRPEAAIPRRRWLILVPVIALALFAFRELTALSPDAARAAWLGETWRTCPWSIAALALIPMAAMFHVARRMAPTRYRTAGAMVGLASGAIAATLYALHCPESSAAFVLTWYSLGIVVSAALGTIFGPKLLRW